MEENTSQKRCIKCKKILIDEKIPLCKRCRLEIRNTALKVGAVAGGALFVLGSVFSNDKNETIPSENIDDADNDDDDDDD